jgi:HNH endonuclease
MNHAPLTGQPVRPEHPMNRLMRRLLIDDNNCWVYRGYLVSGYGQVSTGSAVNKTRKVEYVHRVVYTNIVGEIPSGLEIDHLCRNRAYRLSREKGMQAVSKDIR